MVNHPLIRPYFFGGLALCVYTLCRVLKGGCSREGGGTLGNPKDSGLGKIGWAPSRSL